jgi:hypothetical protein
LVDLGTVFPVDLDSGDTEMKKEGYFEFVERCLKDLTTGRIRVSKRDQQRVAANLRRAGSGSKRSFRDSDELTDAYVDGMDDIEAMLVFEHLRLTQGDLPDPIDELADWTDLSRREYVGIRIIVKLNLLGVVSTDFPNWVSQHCGNRFIGEDGRIAFADEARMLELDQALADLVHDRETDRTT